jgi:hypothetical protein
MCSIEPEVLAMDVVYIDISPDGDLFGKTLLLDIHLQWYNNSKFVSGLENYLLRFVSVHGVRPRL